MKIEQRQVGTVTVLKPEGALVDHDAAQFGHTLLNRLTSGSPRVIVQLSDVPYMDSKAVEVLLEAADDLATRAATLTLVDVPPTCREILEITGHADAFRFFSDVQHAVRSYL